MPRKLVSFLVFLAVLSQAFAAVALPGRQAGQIGHLFVHAQALSHHHHHDEALTHSGADSDTVFHAHADDGANVGLPASPAARSPGAAPQERASQPRRWLPAPVLDGLLRPPRPPG